MMKKIVSLLLTAVLLAAMLTVFAVPASAGEYILNGEKTLDIASNETKIITESEEYDKVYVNGALELGENAQLTTGDLIIHKDGALLLQQGATVKAKKISFKEGYPLFTVPSGVTIKAEEFYLPNELTLDPGAVVEAKKLTGASHLTVSSGATLITSGRDAGLEIDLYGTMKSSEFVIENFGKVHYHKGALLDITFKNPGKIMNFIDEADVEGVADATYLERFIKNENRLYIHIDHAFNNTCANCGEEQSSDLTASTLSEGSLTIIVGIAAAVVFGLGGFILGTKKKKKPAVASGTDEE